MENTDRELYKEVLDNLLRDNFEAHKSIMADVREIKKMIVGNGEVGIAEQVRDNTEWREDMQRCAGRVVIPIVIAIVLAVGAALFKLLAPVILGH